MHSEIHPVLRSIKKLRQFLRYQFTRIYFLVVPRFVPSFSEKKKGINFIGFAQGELGLGQAMRSMVKATLTAQIPLVVRKFQASIPSKQSNDEMASHFSDYCLYPVNLICVNPDTLFHLPSWVSYSEWGRRYNIGYWFWELENFPDKWRYATNIVDEIWVATDYIANAMRKSGKKVVKIPFPLEFEMPPEFMNKQYFRIKPDQFTFLYSFDFLSSMERKNPQGVIKAFKQAFSKGDNSVRLIIKTMNGGHHPLLKNSLELLIDHDCRIEIRDEYSTQDEMRGLIRSSDCYISLHRAEGLGLGLAEAMYLGKPTIATGYSGNTEFMNSGNSILVPYTLVPVPKGAYPSGKDQMWAEPDIEVAAENMQKIVSDRVLRETLGKKASDYMGDKHSYVKAGETIRSQLEQLKYQVIIDPVINSRL